jgi:hypothetical protein
LKRTTSTCQPVPAARPGPAVPSGGDPVPVRGATARRYPAALRPAAVPVEDHELSAGDLEGVHEGSRRGTGVVLIWDEGRAEIRRDDPGHMSVVLHGQRLSGGFGLTRSGERRWVLVEVRGGFSNVRDFSDHGHSR